MKSFFCSTFLILLHVCPTSSTSERNFVEGVPTEPPCQNLEDMNWPGENIQTGHPPRLLPLIPTSPGLHELDSEGDFDKNHNRRVQKTLNLLGQSGFSSCQSQCEGHLVSIGRRESRKRPLSLGQRDHWIEEEDGNHESRQTTTKKRRLDLNLPPPSPEPAIDPLQGKDSRGKYQYWNLNLHPPISSEGSDSSAGSSRSQFQPSGKEATQTPQVEAGPSRKKNVSLNQPNHWPEEENGDDNRPQPASKKRRLDSNLRSPSLEPIIDTAYGPGSRGKYQNWNLNLHPSTSGEDSDSLPDPSRPEMPPDNPNPVSPKVDPVSGSGSRVESPHAIVLYENSMNNVREALSWSPLSKSRSRPSAQLEPAGQLHGVSSHSPNPESPLRNTLIGGIHTHHSSEESGGSEDEKVLIREFYVENINPKIWPWISIIWQRVQKTIFRELEKSVNPLIQEFIDEYLIHPAYGINHQKKNLERNVREEAHRLNNQIKEIRDVSHLLWAINLRVLELIGVDRFDTSYLEEQTKVLRWFVGFILIRIDPSSSHLPNHPKQHLSQQFSDICESLYRKISESVECTENESVYRITLPWKGISHDTTFLSHKEELMNQSAVYLLGFYYKNVNHNKWEKIFGEEDRYFVLRIVNFGHRWMRRPLRISKQAVEKKNGGRMTPWEVPLPDGFSNSPEKKLNNFIFAFERFVVPIQERSNYDIPRFVGRKTFSLGPQDPKLWAWISRMKIRSKLESPPENQPTIALKKDMMNYLAGASHLAEAQKLELLSIAYDDTKLSQKLLFLSDYIWSINTRFLESLGCERSEETFVNEQRWVQMYFGFILSTLIHWKEDFKKSKNLSGQHSLSNQKLTEKFEDLILKYFLLSEEDVEPKFKAKYNDQENSLYSTVTSKDLIMTEMVCNILGTYYKNQNIKKWKLLFKTDRHMFEFLTRISSTKFYSGKTAKYNEDFLPVFKSYKLLPWKAPVEKSSNPLSFRMKSWLRRKPQKSIFKWVEEINQNNNT